MENIMLGRHLYMQTGLFRGGFLWGRKSFAAREEVKHRKKVEEIIDFLDLQAARDKLVGGLPYGTQKQIELGRALALEPELLLLDEPCAGMNSEEKQDMIFWVKDIQDELGITILLIEHDMTMVMDISDRILALNFGRPITEGIPRRGRAGSQSASGLRRQPARAIDPRPGNFTGAGGGRVGPTSTDSRQRQSNSGRQAPRYQPRRTPLQDEEVPPRREGARLER